MLHNQLAAVVNRALELQGTPWVHQGRVPGVGLDCAGLIIESFKAMGYDVVTKAYSRSADGLELTQYLDNYCHVVNYKEAIPGDIILMRWKTHPQHLGIYLGNDWMVHSYINHGVQQQQLVNFWKKRIVNVYRVNKES